MENKLKYQLKHFYDSTTFTLTYIVYDEETKDAIIIDPVLDYDPTASRISYDSINNILNFVDQNRLKVWYILETHAHADHLTGAVELQKKLVGAKIAIGVHIKDVQTIFAEIYNYKNFDTSGQQFDLLLNEEQLVKAGSIEIKTIFTPGHTPACSSYLIGNRLFTGDALFMPDYGTGRCDFPLGSAEQLYHSIHEKLYKLPDNTKIYTGHDYLPGGRELMYKSTIGESKKSNIQLNESTKKEDYIKFRNDRDKTLSAPRLLLPSIQINIRAGNYPDSEDNGVSYLKIPLRSSS